VPKISVTAQAGSEADFGRNDATANIYGIQIYSDFRVRNPIEAGHLIRREAGHRSGRKRAAVPI
jgi:hypothetical protein